MAAYRAAIPKTGQSGHGPLAVVALYAIRRDIH